MSDPQPTSKPGTHSRPDRGRGELARTGALVLLAVLITLFAVFNLDEVKVHWIFGSSKAPLIIVIVISVLVGAVLTYCTERISGKRGKD